MKHPRLQTCFSIGIQFLCITFVLWQTWECIVKYTKSPQGTETHVAFTGKVAFPSITVCSSQTGNKNMPYNESILKLCQINSSDYIEHTHRSPFPDLSFVKTLKSSMKHSFKMTKLWLITYSMTPLIKVWVIKFP